MINNNTPITPVKKIFHYFLFFGTIYSSYLPTLLRQWGKQNDLCKRRLHTGGQAVQCKGNFHNKFRRQQNPELNTLHYKIQSFCRFCDRNLWVLGSNRTDPKERIIWNRFGFKSKKNQVQTFSTLGNDVFSTAISVTLSAVAGEVSKVWIFSGSGFANVSLSA